MYVQLNVFMGMPGVSATAFNDLQAQTTFLKQAAISMNIPYNSNGQPRFEVTSVDGVGYNPYRRCERLSITALITTMMLQVQAQLCAAIFSQQLCPTSLILGRQSLVCHVQACQINT